jgi:hypothetical protein
LSTKSISLYTIMLKVQFMLGGQPSEDVQLSGVRESLRWHIVYYSPIIYQILVPRKL